MGTNALTRLGLREFLDNELSKLKPIGDERYVFGLIDAFNKVKKYLDTFD